MPLTDEATTIDQRIRSSIDKVDWPAVPDKRGSALLAILFQLDRSQWWPAEKIKERQFGQLQRLLAHARRSVPFYRERLKKAPGRHGSPLDQDHWRKTPFLRREDVQRGGNALVSEDLPASHGGVDEIFTSGSTGKPIRVVRSALWGLFWSAITIRDHLWHSRDMTGKLATIRESGTGKAPYPDGTVALNWGRSSSPVFQTGLSVSLNIACTFEQQVDWLQRQAPDYLLTHPSIAQCLAEHCIAEGVRLPTLRQVETISEILRPATRDLCQQAWGVPVVDMYSAREAGYIALQCPEHEHYHVQAEGIFVEILDDQGRSCAPGQIGRVVVTPLHNFAMPLIRYDIGDYAEVGEPCPCGRGLPVLQRILGRQQNMLVMPSGEERWPLLSSSDIDRLCEIAPIRQYQFAQTAPDEIELRLVVGRALTLQDNEYLCAWVREKFGYPFNVRVNSLDNLPRTSAGKFTDFMNEIK